MYMHLHANAILSQVELTDINDKGHIYDVISINN